MALDEEAGQRLSFVTCPAHNGRRHAVILHCSLECDALYRPTAENTKKVSKAISSTTTLWTLMRKCQQVTIC